MPEITPDTGFPIKIDVFSQFADLLGKVGNSLGKLAAGIKEAIETGRDLRRSYLEELRIQRLVTLRKDLVIHNNMNNQELLSRINTFLDDSSGSNWELVRQHLDTTISPFLNQIIREVVDEDGSWTLESSYKDLVAVLHGRQARVARLKSLDAPSSVQEIEGLRSLTVRYQELMAQLDAVSDALAAYIRHQQGASGTKSRNRPSKRG
jgi:hypothetical protein